ncbi:hypothetical protein [Streptomyces zagrosensis]|uniref:Leucine-binding protein domain-containing protein n=1 Tax=Streptomyces zagrosensis TaxID=1042984 RepID=A0A7W9V082_9ACTN|nr:hypothetical protein [Streptomyces zagrosensis]MBB5937051.1 hypothetical protein [Streptomyces zagrosensis]
MTKSSRLRDWRGGGEDPVVAQQGPHTELELRALIALLHDQRPRVRSVSIGHARNSAARAAARAFAAAWRADNAFGRTEDSAGAAREAADNIDAAIDEHTVLAVVDWPEQAASWLRQARRFAAGAPDAWVVCGAPAGWARMARRLRLSTDWSPAHTYAFASLGTADMVELAGAQTVEGLRGVTSQGGHWEISRGGITLLSPRSPSPSADPLPLPTSWAKTRS